MSSTATLQLPGLGSKPGALLAVHRELDTSIGIPSSHFIIGLQARNAAHVTNGPGPLYTKAFSD